MKGKREQDRRENGENGNPITKVLREFRKSNPPSFKGSHDPDIAQVWMNQMEKIFEIMECNS